jgi:hypothetical protein
VPANEQMTSREKPVRLLSGCSMVFWREKGRGASRVGLEETIPEIRPSLPLAGGGFERTAATP